MHDAQLAEQVESGRAQWVDGPEQLHRMPDEYKELVVHQMMAHTEGELSGADDYLELFYPITDDPHEKKVCYSKHGSGEGTSGDAHFDQGGALLSEALRARQLHPRTVVNTEYYIKVLINGRSHWGESFGYATCPSISNDHAMNRKRIIGGHKVLPLFNAFASDLKTIEFCCTSGHCDECRDSQAVYSWLLVPAGRFLRTPAFAEAWIDLAEGYWKQFVWSPFK